MSSNGLQGLPDSIGLLKELRVLTLKSNQIKDIPGTIGDLMLLERLDISENLVAQLPWQMGHMKNIQTIDVANNSIVIPPTPEVNKGTKAMLEWLRENEVELKEGVRVNGLGLEKGTPK